MGEELNRCGREQQTQHDRVLQVPLPAVSQKLHTDNYYSPRSNDTIINETSPLKEQSAAYRRNDRPNKLILTAGKCLGVVSKITLWLKMAEIRKFNVPFYNLNIRT